MRIGLSPGGDLARRVGLVLLADARITELGVSQPTSDEPRTVPLTGFTADAVIAVEPGHPYATAAQEAGTPIFTPQRRGTSLTGGLEDLARALAASAANDDQVDLVAWTAHGQALREGTAIPFPQPLGTVTGAPADGGLEAPVTGPWAGVFVSLSTTSGEKRIAVVDDARFLRAVALAARALAYLGGESELGSLYIDEARAAGVEFAVSESR